MSYTLKAPSQAPLAPSAPETSGGFTLKAPTVAEQPSVAGPTERQKELTSAGGRFERGFMNPFHGAAQALMHALPKDAVNRINELANRIGGEGTILGSLGIKGMKTEDMDRMLAEKEKEYQEAVKVADPGFDVAGLLGEAASPTNLMLAGGGGAAVVAKEGVKKTAAKLGLLGAAAGGLQPVTSGEAFAGEKTGQIATGAVTGAVLGPVLMKAADSLGTYVSGKLAKGAGGKAAGDITQEVQTALAKDGIDINQIPEGLRFEFMEDVKKSLREGTNLDPAALLRKADFKKLGIQPTLGQVTRDPTQFSRELNLRGVPGGEDIADRLALQQQQIQGKFQQGTRGAMEPYEAGAALIKDIEGKNFEMEQGVRKAYKAFKDSTGKEMEVSLQGLAQDFANINKEYPIPAIVQNRFKEFGLLGGKQTKLMNVDDAEQLIKTINNNYNPMNPAEKRGLDNLRQAVIRSIDESSETATDTLTAQLAKTARATAKERFNVIAENPAFKAAINKKAAPDDFVKKYVIGGKADDLERLTNLVSPETRNQMRVQFMRHLQNKAFGANVAGDASSRQASFNQELQNIGTKKLTAILGKEQAEEMMSLGRVMAFIQSRPAGSSVNESNTASAVASLLTKLGGPTRGMPIVGELVVKPLEAAKLRTKVKSALAAELPQGKTPLDPKVLRALSRLAGSATVISSIAASD